MPDWEERITADSRPTLRLEHSIRYAAAAPIALSADVWCDLGCGTAAGSSQPLGSFGGRAVLVDIDAAAVSEARQQFTAATTTGIVADAATQEGLDAVRAALLPAERGCITCFEVIEHLADFAPAVEMLTELAEQHDFTVVLSVPNDGFWDMQNPFHLSRWSEGAFAELTSVLPSGHVLAYQTALTGSCVVRENTRFNVEAEVLAVNVPTHFLVAFGARAEELGTPAALAPSDLDGQRTWERQREADLGYFKTLAKRRWR